MLGDTYGLVPTYGRVVGVGRWDSVGVVSASGICCPVLVWIASSWKEGSIGKVEVVPDVVNVNGGVDEDVCGSRGAWCWMCTGIPGRPGTRLLGGGRASRAWVSQAESYEVPCQVCCCRGGLRWTGGIVGRSCVMGGTIHRKLDKGESRSGSTSIASFLNANLHLLRNILFVSAVDEARVLVKCSCSAAPMYGWVGVDRCWPLWEDMVYDWTVVVVVVVNARVYSVIILDG